MQQQKTQEIKQYQLHNNEIAKNYAIYGSPLQAIGNRLHSHNAVS
jgi:hypothetical protein